jgi:hypothetical protein
VNMDLVAAFRRVDDLLDALGNDPVTILKDGEPVATVNSPKDAVEWLFDVHPHSLTHAITVAGYDLQPAPTSSG